MTMLKRPDRTDASVSAAVRMIQRAAASTHDNSVLIKCGESIEGLPRLLFNY